jgi:hypothetical protein
LIHFFYGTFYGKATTNSPADRNEIIHSGASAL